MDTNKTTLQLNPTIWVGENYNFIELNFIISHTPHRVRLQSVFFVSLSFYSVSFTQSRAFAAFIRSNQSTILNPSFNN